MIDISLQILPHAEGLPLPARATAEAAGFDLRAAIDAPLTLAPGQRALVPTGLIFVIPSGWEGQVRPRSGLAIRHGVTLINSPGTIDADYRGELLLPMVNLGDVPFPIQRGERLAQIIFSRFAVPTLTVVTAIAVDTARGVKGFGSTGTT